MGYESISFCSEGSVVADMVVTLYDHPAAEDIFAAAFSELDLNKLFPGQNVMSSFNLPCMFFFKFAAQMTE